MRKIFLTIFIFIGGIITFHSCKKESVEEMMQDLQYCKDSLVSFSENVQPILLDDCAGCHSGSNAENGVELDHYSGVVDAENGGILMDVIHHRNGAVAMPQGKPKLNECKINTIQKWIDEGMQNN